MPHKGTRRALYGSRILEPREVAVIDGYMRLGDVGQVAELLKTSPDKVDWLVMMHTDTVPRGKEGHRFDIHDLRSIWVWREVDKIGCDTIAVRLGMKARRVREIVVRWGMTPGKIWHGGQKRIYPERQPLPAVQVKCCGLIAGVRCPDCPEKGGMA